MGGGRAEHDYNKIEMLLREIPHLSSRKSHSSGSRPAHSSLSDPFTNLYNAPETVEDRDNAAFYRGFALQTPTGVNSSNGPLDHKLQSNRDFDGGEANVSWGVN